MWPWRDWVIDGVQRATCRSTGSSVEQLAGDLLPDATLRAEGRDGVQPQPRASTPRAGIIAEEYRVEYVADRVAHDGDGVPGPDDAAAPAATTTSTTRSRRRSITSSSPSSTTSRTGQASYSNFVGAEPFMRVPSGGAAGPPAGLEPGGPTWRSDQDREAGADAAVAAWEQS